MKDAPVVNQHEYDQLKEFVSKGQISKELAEIAKTELDNGNLLIYTQNANTKEIVSVKPQYNAENEKKRKRQIKENKEESAEENEKSIELKTVTQETPVKISSDEDNIQPKKRGRGRPRIHPIKIVDPNQPKRKRGRPKKIK